MSSFMYEMTYNSVQLVACDANSDCIAGDVEHFSADSACDTDTLDFLRGVNADGAVSATISFLATRHSLEMIGVIYTRVELI